MNPVQKLKDRYDSARRLREEREERERPFKDRVALIMDAPRFVTTDFWCNTCQRDCRGTGYRQASTVRPECPTAWFIAYCPRGHRMIRRITDKSTDPYYELSFLVQRQRFDLRDAILTPEDPRFKILYPKQYAELFKKDGRQKTNN